MKEYYKRPKALYIMWHKMTMTRKAIGDELGVSQSTIQHWVNKFGINKGYNDPRVVEHLYHNKGWSMYEIADHFCGSQTSVLETMQEYDIDSRNKGQQPRDGVNYVIDSRGHTRWRGEYEQCAVHQLLQISKGVDPHKIFSNAEWHTHHKNEIPWDNRPSNLETITAGEHAKKHPEGQF